MSFHAGLGDPATLIDLDNKRHRLHRVGTLELTPAFIETRVGKMGGELDLAGGGQTFDRVGVDVVLSIRTEDHQMSHRARAFEKLVDAIF